MAEISYRRHRFPPVIIQHAVWLYLRFTLSYRDVEELLAERGLDISYDRATATPVPAAAEQSLAPGTRWWYGSPESGCICGVPSITRARSSTCWFSVGATLGRRCG